MSKYTQKQGESILYFRGVYSLIVITEQDTEFATVYLTDVFLKIDIKSKYKHSMFLNYFL